VPVQLTDFVGSFSFILATLLPLCANGVYAPRQIAVTVCVLAARLELAGYLLYRVLRRGRDERFDSIRSNFGAFLGFWIGQVSACAALRAHLPPLVRVVHAAPRKPLRLHRLSAPTTPSTRQSFRAVSQPLPAQP
jgi:predicted membrane channel-forming protein YqfA (hemolysin III family)